MCISTHLDILSLPTRRSSDLRACEVQARGHLLHLREGYLETRGRNDALAVLIVRSAPAFAALVSNLARLDGGDRKSTRLNSSHANISYAVFCSKKKIQRSYV